MSAEIYTRMYDIIMRLPSNPDVWSIRCKCAHLPGHRPSEAVRGHKSRNDTAAGTELVPADIQLPRQRWRS